MDQTLAIRRTDEIDREQIVKMQETTNRRAFLIRGSGTTLLVVLNLVVSPFVLPPLLCAVNVAFMPSNELFTTEMNLVPKAPTFENFRQALVKVPLARFVFNSFLVAGLTTLGQVIPCSLTAFSFSFLEFKGKEIPFMLVMATMIVSGEATTISNYLVVDGFNWLNSYQVLIAPCLTSTMGIFLSRQFYKSFPMSLYESARIDGRTNLRFIFRILLPLAKSAIRVMAIYMFVNTWSMYMWPLLVTGSNEMRTVQIGISILNNESAQSIALMIVGVVLVIIPSIAIFVAGQEQLTRGMFSGAVKS